MNSALTDIFERRSHAGIHAFSPNPDYDYEIRSALGHCTGGAGEPGEILAATAGIGKNDHEGWYNSWFALAERVAGIAQDAMVAGHHVSAASASLRASAYYAVAVNAVSAQADSSRLAPTFAKQQAAWEGFIEHTAAHVDVVAIPYESGSLPGWFFRPVGASVDTPVATLVAVNGSDGSLAALWATCVAPALERGYNVLVFDGPGQQSELFVRNVPFRPDWEHVLTPVYDFVAAQAGVDAASIALYGISQGSYWVARALAFEHRYVAAITDPGVVDVSTSWTGQIPAPLLKMLDAGDVEKFDKDMGVGMKFSPDTARTWQFRARPYGTSGYGETIDAVRSYTVAAVAGQITTPLAILAPEGEQFWPGQSEQLASLTPSVSTVIPFSAAEGADEHCQPLARTLTAQRMFDWLDDRVAQRSTPTR